MSSELSFSSAAPTSARVNLAVQTDGSPIDTVAAPLQNFADTVAAPLGDDSSPRVAAPPRDNSSSVAAPPLDISSWVAAPSQHDESNVVAHQPSDGFGQQDVSRNGLATGLATRSPLSPIVASSNDLFSRMHSTDFEDSLSDHEVPEFHRRERELIAMKSQERSWAASSILTPGSNINHSTSNVTVVAQSVTETLHTIEAGAIEKWWLNVAERFRNGQTFKVARTINPSTLGFLKHMFEGMGVGYIHLIEEWSIWSWEIALQTTFPDLALGKPTAYNYLLDMNINLAVEHVKLTPFWDGKSITPVANWLQKATLLVDNDFNRFRRQQAHQLFSTSHKQTELAFVKKLIENLSYTGGKHYQVSPTQHLYDCLKSEYHAGRNKDFADMKWLTLTATKIAKAIITLWADASKVFIIPKQQRGTFQQQSNKKRVEDTVTPHSTSKKARVHSYSTHAICNGCGLPGHTHSDCQKSEWPWFNPNPHIEWVNSEQARPLIAKNNGKPTVMSLAVVKNLGMESALPTRAPPTSAGRSSAKTNSSAGQPSAKTHSTAGQPSAKRARQQGTEIIYALNDSEYKMFSTELTLMYNSRSLQVTNALIDSGCLASNYGSEALMHDLLKIGAVACSCAHCSPVCSAFGECRLPINQFDVKVRLTVDSKLTTFPITIKILPSLNNYDLIIGRETIVKHDLMRLVSRNPAMITAGTTANESMHALQSLTTGNPNKLTYTYSKEELLDIEPNQLDDDDDLDKASWWESQVATDSPTTSSSSTAEQPTNALDQLHIEGSTEFRKKVRELAEEYNDVFSTTLPEQPANLPPFELIVDEAKWKHKRNRQPVRLQSVSNNEEIQRQINTLLKSNIIKQSSATEYSQTLLVPKPRSTKKRMCQDFRYLNDISNFVVYPMPHIKAIFTRIGNKTPKIFAVMDLTQGYHQVGVAINSQQFTAFICFLGIFEYLRVPFGLKGAPAYFQMLMATVVLAGLITIICECYLDDVIVYAQTEEELLERLRSIWERFRKYRLVVNPAKTKIGLLRIEYVGHELDGKTGSIGFSAEKIDKVLQIPRPITHNHMKAFLGVANYFRDHIRGYADMTRPLQDLIRPYNKRAYRKLVWTPAAEKSFAALVTAINQLPRLHFLSDHGEIHLFTDASKYGIGGYLCQIVEGIEYPIAFVSQMLTTQQEKTWSVPEKEAYAIFICFKKLEYLIRDRKFTLHTDHRNLTFLNTSGSSRVLRWKLSIQEFDFTVQYIQGERNLVADSFSRELPGHTLTAAERRDLILSEEHDLKKVETLNNLFEEHPVPTDKWNIIAQYHNSTMGHAGQERTVQRLAKHNHHWQYLRDHVRQFVSKCPICQKLSYIKPLINVPRFTLAHYLPFECINIDTIGPLREDKHGNKHIVVIIDAFSRWVELYAVKSTEAIEGAKALLHTIGRFGIPSFLKSDRGSQFVNTVMKELTRLLLIEHELTTAYSHEENGIVERANKEVMRHLRAILLDKNQQDDWSDCLPLVQRIMNASTHESIGASPAELLFGNAVNLDRGLFATAEASDPKLGSQHREQVKLSDWVEKMLMKQTQLIKLAQDTQAKTNSEHMHPTTTRKRKERATQKPISEFRSGQYVLKEYPESRLGKQPPHKLMPNRQGPFLVVNSSGSLVTIKNLVTNKNSTVHMSQLVPFKNDSRHHEPRQVANTDRLAWDVEKIMAHKGNSKKVSTLKFLVHWAGFDHSEDTWEPWKELRTNGALHNYLRAHGLESLIPRQYQGQESEGE